MSAFRMLAIVPLAAFAVACGRSEQPKDQGMDPALMSDLESAAAPTSALASSQFKPTQVVSAIELGESPRARAPERTAAPARQVKPRAAAPKVKTVDPTATEPQPEPVLVATTPAPAPEPAAAPAPVATPSAGPRPTPNPVDIPAPVGRDPIPVGRGGMGGIGTIGTIGAIGRIGGVIIRGGSIGDDDHCEIHPGGRGGIMINVPSPVIRPTFPRGAW
ncbi:MAG TPA: hypothetical protein VIR34_03435 [Gemmatimonadaceae bacterium]